MEAGKETTRGRVLVVEDDPALRNVIRFNLQAAGFEVLAGRDGAQGWELAQREAVDMVVTDMQMPSMTGLELCQKLRGDVRFAQLPVLMLTAKGLELDHERLRAELGVVEVMFKPFSPKQLARAVAQHLGAAAGQRA
ncbi:MAG TPA: response regulator [Pirellulales bacterium]|nr:response regulator [Pirellulales bacterium]